MTTGRRPRIGVVGLGWIGQLRLEALAAPREEDEASGSVTAPGEQGHAPGAVAALCEPDPERLAAAGQAWPEAWRCTSLEALLEEGPELDGAVVCTPNALHCRQARALMERDIAPFVQKPLGIEPSEVEDVLAMAEARDLPLAVDLSYRGLEGARRLRERIAAGLLGEVFLVEGAFHNGYGPDKAWCFDRSLSGGGALLDLGIHLLDLAFWCTGSRGWSAAEGWYRELPGSPGIDGFAEVEGRMEGGGSRFRIAASWNAHAGRDCDLRLTFHGSEASAEIRNLQGSFYDFETVLRTGRTEERVALDRRTWMDRPVREWVERLARGAGFDPAVRSNLSLARLLERVYGAPEPEVRPAASAISSSAR